MNSVRDSTQEKKPTLVLGGTSKAGYQPLIDAVLNTPGDTDSSLRRAVEARAAELSGRSNGAGSEIPPEIACYVDKVALHAYQTTDTDIDALQQAEYSEDAIFEITLSAALGAGVARLERGMAALSGGNQ